MLKAIKMVPSIPVPSPLATIIAMSTYTSWMKGTVSVDIPTSADPNMRVKGLPHRSAICTAISAATADEPTATIVIIPKSVLEAPIWAAYTGINPKTPAKFENTNRMAIEEVMSNSGCVTTRMKLVEEVVLTWSPVGSLAYNRPSRATMPSKVAPKKVYLKPCTSAIAPPQAVAITTADLCTKLMTPMAWPVRSR